MRVALLTLVAVLTAVGTTLAGGQPATSARKPGKPTDLETSRHLWGTVNVCDTAESPDTIGIRGSMPGLGDRRSKLRIRFQVQYKAKADGKWHNAAESSDSGWKTLGRTKSKVFDSGQNFTFKPPADGGFHQLRGSVRFKWVRKRRVVERARRFTEPGHTRTVGADPKGYSAAECEIA